MTRTSTYGFREGTLDTVRRSMRTVAVHRDDGELVGRVVRGELAGCERTGTFRWESIGGAATTVGIRRATWRSAVGRLLRPTYAVTHRPDVTAPAEGEPPAPVHDELKEIWGENVLYFAVDGTVQGRRVVARADWDGSVEVREQGEDGGRPRRVARFHSGGMFSLTRVEVDHEAAGTTRDGALFGVLMLLPFVARLHREESSLIEELLG